MSGISPGSRTTTSLFMIITLLTLAALVWRGSQQDTPADDCMTRLVSIDARVESAPATATLPVTVKFDLLTDGSIADPIVVSTGDPRDEQTLGALSDARFSPGDATNCVFYFPDES